MTKLYLHKKDMPGFRLPMVMIVNYLIHAYYNHACSTFTGGRTSSYESKYVDKAEKFLKLLSNKEIEMTKRFCDKKGIVFPLYFLTM